jgi:histidinol-phosphate aminotransferase
MMDIYAIARPEIVAMKPYQSARKTSSADGILLNANEAPTSFVDGPDLKRLALNRYPPPQPANLRTQLARLYDVPESSLLLTRGSDEGIDLLTRVFCRPGEDAIVECSPCFGMYRIAATIQAARVIDVPRQPQNGLRIDFDALEKTIRDEASVRLVFLTSPNNPTGDLIERDQLERILQVCDGKALVVLDEAYIEFCSSKSASDLIDRWPHLVVLRTLSKAWAAAGVRCGTVIANPAVIDLLLRVIAPYPMAATAIDAAMQATSGAAVDRKAQFIKDVVRDREDLIIFLKNCPWVIEIWQSRANFVLIRVPDADGLVTWCDTSGLKIRNFSSQAGLAGCVRLTIGSDKEMAKLKAALEAFGEQQ